MSVLLQENQRHLFPYNISLYGTAYSFRYIIHMINSITNIIKYLFLEPPQICYLHMKQVSLNFFKVESNHLKKTFSLKTSLLVLVCFYFKISNSMYNKRQTAALKVSFKMKC